MGAWDIGPFDNDGAMDLVCALSDGSLGDPVDVLRSTISDVVDCSEYVEAPEMSAAIAGACIVAAKIDASVPLNRSVKQYLDAMTFSVDEELRRLGTIVFTRATNPANNEWYDLWADAGALASVEVANAPYKRVITQ
jgi:hypothetical protein